MGMLSALCWLWGLRGSMSRLPVPFLVLFGGILYDRSQGHRALEEGWEGG